MGPEFFVYSERTWSIIVASLFLLGIGIMSWYRAQAARTGDTITLKEEGTGIMVTLRVFGALLWLSTLLYCIMPEYMGWAYVALPGIVRFAGIVITFCGMIFIVWMYRSIGSNITTTVVIKREHQLITSGIYAWVRHPLYTFGAVVFAGFAIIAANWFILLSLVGTMILLIMRLPEEERRLIERFGDEYLSYQERVGALLPRFPRRSSKNISH